MKRFLVAALFLLVLAACGHGDSASSDDQPQDGGTHIEIITGFTKAPDGNYYEEVKINDRRCTVAQYYDTDTPAIDCQPPETTTTLYVAR